MKKVRENIVLFIVCFLLIVCYFTTPIEIFVATIGGVGLGIGAAVLCGEKDNKR
jgi:dolichol kinase